MSSASATLPCREDDWLILSHSGPSTVEQDAMVAWSACLLWCGRARLSGGCAVCGRAERGGATGLGRR